MERLKCGLSLIVTGALAGDWRVVRQGIGEILGHLTGRAKD